MASKHIALKKNWNSSKSSDGTRTISNTRWNSRQSSIIWFATSMLLSSELMINLNYYQTQARSLSNFPMWRCISSQTVHPIWRMLMTLGLKTSIVTQQSCPKSENHRPSTSKSCPREKRVKRLWTRMQWLTCIKSTRNMLRSEQTSPLSTLVSKKMRRSRVQLFTHMMKEEQANKDCKASVENSIRSEASMHLSPWADKKSERSRTWSMLKNRRSKRSISKKHRARNTKQGRNKWDKNRSWTFILDCITSIQLTRLGRSLRKRIGTGLQNNSEKII